MYFCVCIDKKKPKYTYTKIRLPPKLLSTFCPFFVAFATCVPYFLIEFTFLSTFCLPYVLFPLFCPLLSTFRLRFLLFLNVFSYFNVSTYFLLSPFLWLPDIYVLLGSLCAMVEGGSSSRPDRFLTGPDLERKAQ